MACENGHLPVVQHLVAVKAGINHQTKVNAVHIVKMLGEMLTKGRAEGEIQPMKLG